MNGAGATLARLGLGQHRAADATVSFTRSDGACALLGASMAGDGTGAPVGPLGHDAIERARVTIAAATADAARARLATVHSGHDHGSGTGAASSSAGLGAAAPTAPAGHHAVHGASMGVAGAGLGKQRALLAAVLDGDVDSAASRLEASAARLGASGPDSVPRHLAVNRASVEVAGSVLGGGRARAAAVSGRAANTPGALVLAHAARVGAGAPVGPPSHDTVLRAVVGVASLGLAEGLTLDTAVCGRDTDAAGA